MRRILAPGFGFFHGQITSVVFSMEMISGGDPPPLWTVQECEYFFDAGSAFR
jgi:hypothetical protein